jgi:hypothetical protein
MGSLWVKDKTVRKSFIIITLLAVSTLLLLPVYSTIYGEWDITSEWTISPDWTIGPIGISVTSPTNTIYAVDTLSISFTASGFTVDKQWFNIQNGSTWIYPTNQSYTIPTTISSFTDGVYTFYAYANNTIGQEFSSTVPFAIAIPATGTVPTPGSGTSSLSVLFKVAMNGKPVENCQIRISTSTYQDYVGTYMTDAQGKATAYLPVGTYDYSASYQQKRVSGTFQHIEEETIELDLGTGQITQIPALDRTQVTKIGIALIVVVGAVFAIVTVTKKKRW